MRLTRDAYEKLIAEDLAYLDGLPHSLEKMHIRAIVQASVAHEYDTFNLVAHLIRQIRFSGKTFGPGTRTEGVVDHIRKELAEILQDPTDVEEWIDVIILGCDGAWRALSGSGKSDVQIAEIVCRELAAKLAKNESRVWPDWRTASPDKAIEHVR